MPMSALPLALSSAVSWITAIGASLAALAAVGTLVSSSAAAKRSRRRQL
jgi:hypothetical protein